MWRLWRRWLVVLVLESGAFAQDVQFIKGATGDAAVVGQYVTGDGTRTQRSGNGRLFGAQDSHERTAQKGREEIEFLANYVQLPQPREALIEQAFRLYKLALQHSFTKGRRVDQVAAACLYTICRIDGKPFMLIDFSDALQVNVFTLGNVFMQLMQLLRMQEHPLINKPVDPSLYLDRFAKKLGFKEKTGQVVETALHLVASMKRDWMQTGRRPSGICGAALYLAAHIHGFERTKRQVIAVVHIGEQTLHKRVMEFANTTSADMLADAFEETARELVVQQEQQIENMQAEEEAPENTATCSKSAPHFVHGLCLGCYKEAVQLSGGYNLDHPLLQGRDPPATAKLKWQEAQRIQKRQKQLQIEAPEEQARITEEFESTLHESNLMQLAQYCSNERPDSDTEQPAGSNNPPGVGESPHPPPNTLDSAATTSHHPGTNSHVNSHMSQAASMQPGSTVGDVGEDVYDWNCMGPWVRRWVAQWVAFDEQGQEANGNLFANYCRYCRQHGLPPPPPLTKSSREIRFSIFLTKIIKQMAAQQGFEGDVCRCMVAGGVRGINCVRLQEEAQPLSEQDAAMIDMDALPPRPSAANTKAPTAPPSGDGDESEGALSEEAPTEPLSDLEDDEIDAFIHTVEESKMKELVWNTMHKEYLEQQEARMAARARQQQLEQQREAAGAKPKRKRSVRRDLSGETAAEAVNNMLQSKKLSKKINYENVKMLFQETEQDTEPAARQGSVAPGASTAGSVQGDSVAAGLDDVEPPVLSGLVNPPPPTMRRSRPRAPRAPQRVPGRGRGRGRGTGVAPAPSTSTAAD